MATSTQWPKTRDKITNNNKCFDRGCSGKLCDDVMDIGKDALNINDEGMDRWIQWDGSADVHYSTSTPPSRSAHSSLLSKQWSENNHGFPVRADGDTIDDDTFLLEDAPFQFDERISEPSLPPSLQTVEPLSSGPTNWKPLELLQRSYQACSSLTEAEEQVLRDIAMPHRAEGTASRNSGSTLSPSPSPSASPSPVPAKRVQTRKRKRSTKDTAEPRAHNPVHRGSHNEIEKRYRNNLNAKINCLDQGVPKYYHLPESDGEDGAARKCGKSAILTRALEYIKHLEKDTKRLEAEVGLLETHIGALQHLAPLGSVMNPESRESSFQRSIMPDSQIVKVDMKSLGT